MPVAHCRVSSTLRYHTEIAYPWRMQSHTESGRNGGRGTRAAMWRHRRAGRRLRVRNSAFTAIHSSIRTRIDGNLPALTVIRAMHRSHFSPTTSRSSGTTAVAAVVVGVDDVAAVILCFEKRWSERGSKSRPQSVLSNHFYAYQCDNRTWYARHAYRQPGLYRQRVVPNHGNLPTSCAPKMATYPIK